MGNETIDEDTGQDKGKGQGDFIPGKPYSRLGRELSEEDLSNPAVQKLLLNDIDKLEIRVSQLEAYEIKYHEVDKEKAVLQEKMKTATSQEILYTFCLSFGSGALGLTTIVKLNEGGWIFLVSGCVLMLGGILSKFVVKWK